MSLDTVKAIRSNLFVRLTINGYAGGATQVFRFGDSLQQTEIYGEQYLGVGRLLSITEANSELRPSTGELSIVLSGIPNSSLTEILTSDIKGSPVTIYRRLTDPVTGALISVAGNPFTRYKGFVNNYSLQEDHDVISRSSSNTILLLCNTQLDVVKGKISGRKTNPQSEKKWFPNDLSMDRVPTLVDAQFDFGKGT